MSATCVVCRVGETKVGNATFTAERGRGTFVLRDVPASVCEQCGAAYFDEAVTEKVYEQVERALRSGVDVVSLTYEAA